MHEMTTKLHEKARAQGVIVSSLSCNSASQQLLLRPSRSSLNAPSSPPLQTFFPTCSLPLSPSEFRHIQRRRDHFGSRSATAGQESAVGPLFLVSPPYRTTPYLKSTAPLHLSLVPYRTPDLTIPIDPMCSRFATRNSSAR